MSTLTYEPATALEAAVLESGRFELSTDTNGRAVLHVGHRRMPKVVLPRDADGLRGLMGAVESGRAFSVTEGDPWCIEVEDAEDPPETVAAEEALVMGLRPMRSEGRPIRVASGRGVVRLFLLAWTMPAKTVDFGNGQHYVVTGARGVTGEWVPADRRGVVVGVSEAWVGIIDRGRADLVSRCDVPVPWIGQGGLANAVPAAVGLFDEGTWLARLPVVFTEGTVVDPVSVPDDIEVADVPDGPWEHALSDPGAAMTLN